MQITVRGHNTQAMVERYSHANAAHIQTAMQRLESRIRLDPISPIQPGTTTQELHKDEGATAIEAVTP